MSRRLGLGLSDHDDNGARDGSGHGGVTSVARRRALARRRGAHRHRRWGRVCGAPDLRAADLARLTAFAITDDGSLTSRRTWAELGEGAAPDGICLDASGAVWYADVPNRHCRRVAEGGKVLDTVEVDHGCFACMLGGPDGRLLHIVATDWESLDWQHGGGGERTGRVLTYRAAVPHAGCP
jgi:hypothetical protein